jgi:RimJ/RimL family protein N-acetyltransferase
MAKPKQYKRYSSEFKRGTIRRASEECNHGIKSSLLLRPLVKSDADWCIDMLGDPAVTRYIFDGECLTEDQVRAELERSARRGGSGCIGIWAIIESSSGECIGSVFLLPLPTDEDDTNLQRLESEEIPPGEIELGYILRKPAWGKGYATEATARLVRFAFEQTPLQELAAVTDSVHQESQKVLRKLGLFYR